MLRYVGAPNALPATPPPQPQSVEPWTPAEQDSKFVMASRLLAAGAAGRRYPGYEEAMKRVRPALILGLGFGSPLARCASARSACQRLPLSACLTDCPPG